MSTNEQRMRNLIAEQAAYWIVENREALDPEQRSEFVAWLKASPVHVEEYLALAALTQDLPSACELAGESVEQLVAAARRAEQSVGPAVSPLTPPPLPETRSRAWRLLALAASFSALVIGSMIFLHFGSASRPTSRADAATQHLLTGHGEQRTFQLADQSVVHLNTDTAVTVRIDRDARLVILEHGEAVFEVTHEQGRPFRVSAGPAQVEDVGTIFDVKVSPAAALVTVVSGQVKLGLTRKFEQASPYLQLVAGQQARVADGTLPAQPSTVDVARETAWLHRQINFQNEPLGLVTDEFNRYATVPFEIDSQTLRNLKISGTFAIDDSEAFMAFLRTLPGVRVHVTPTHIRVSQN